MEIRIRHSGQVNSILLGEVPFRADAIDSIIPTITGWGGEIDGVTIHSINTVGQFADDGQKAFFEVVIGVDD